VFRYFDSLGGLGLRYVDGLKQYFVDEVTTREREIKRERGSGREKVRVGAK
jgi:hypothetical protein